MTFLTIEEVKAIQHLPRKNVYLISGIGNTQLSIARHHGGIKYMGSHYTYIPTTDELIRDDVLKFAMKRRKEKEKQHNRVVKDNQKGLFDANE